MTPIIRNAANMVIESEVKVAAASGDSLDVKKLGHVFTMSSIMSTGFNIGIFDDIFDFLRQLLIIQKNFHFLIKIWCF